MINVEFERMFEENMKLVFLVIKQRFPTFIYDEDIIQIGYLGLWSAINTYDDSKAKFSTYAYWCVYHEISKHFRRLMKQEPDECKRVKELVSMDSLINVAGDYDIAWLDFRSFYDSLCETDRLIVDLRIFGLTQYEIADRLNVSQRTVCGRLSKMKTTFKKFV